MEGIGKGAAAAGRATVLNVSKEGMGRYSLETSTRERCRPAATTKHSVNNSEPEVGPLREFTGLWWRATS